MMKMAATMKMTVTMNMTVRLNLALKMKLGMHMTVTMNVAVHMNMTVMMKLTMMDMLMKMADAAEDAPRVVQGAPPRAQVARPPVAEAAPAPRPGPSPSSCVPCCRGGRKGGGTAKFSCRYQAGSCSEHTVRQEVHAACVGVCACAADSASKKRPPAVSVRSRVCACESSCVRASVGA